jgi:hypothetical protein
MSREARISRQDHESGNLPKVLSGCMLAGQDRLQFSCAGFSRSSVSSRALSRTLVPRLRAAVWHG